MSMNLYEAFKLTEGEWKEPTKLTEATGDEMRMYVDGEDGTYDLVFEVNGKIVERQPEGSFENVMIDCYDFFEKNCEKYGVESRVNTLEVTLTHTFY